MSDFTRCPRCWHHRWGQCNCQQFELIMPEYGNEIVTAYGTDCQEVAEEYVEQWDCGDYDLAKPDHTVQINVRKVGELEWKQFVVAGEHVLNYVATPR